MPHGFRRVLSVFIAFHFLITTAFAGPVSAVQTPVIPSEWGTVDESYQGTSPKTLIYIQDAHDSLEAQENIARIIHHLVKKQGVQTVFEEGYEGPVPTDELFGSIQEPELKEKISWFLLDRLRIGAAEYAHINRKEDFRLIGADSLKLHRDNVAWSLTHSKVQQEVEEDLSDLTRHLQGLVDRYFPKGVKEWLKLRARFDSKELSFIDYLKRTRESLLETLSSQDFKEQYPSLGLLSEMSLSQDPKLVQEARLLNAKALFREIERMEHDFITRALTGERERTIFQYSKKISLLRRLNSLEVTPEEYEISRAGLDDLSTEALAEFLAAQAGNTVVVSKRWEQGVKSALRFYETAQAREGSLESVMDEFGESTGGTTALLVYGGFHKAGIQELLRKKGFSYIIISPRITREDPKHRAYYKELMSKGYYDYETAGALAQAARVWSYPEMAAQGENTALVKNYIRKLHRAAQERPEASLDEVPPPFTPALLAGSPLSFAEKEEIQRLTAVIETQDALEVVEAARALSLGSEDKSVITLKLPGNPQFDRDFYQKILQEIHSSPQTPFPSEDLHRVGDRINRQMLPGFTPKLELIRKVANILRETEDIGTAQLQFLDTKPVREVRVVLVDRGEASYFGEGIQNRTYVAVEHDEASGALTVYLTKRFVEDNFKLRTRAVTQVILYALLESVIGFTHPEAVLVLSWFNSDETRDPQGKVVLSDAHRMFLSEIRRKADEGDEEAVRYLVALVEKQIPEFPRRVYQQLSELPDRSGEWLRAVSQLSNETAKRIDEFIKNSVGKIGEYTYVKREALGNGYVVNLLDYRQKDLLDKIFKVTHPREDDQYLILTKNGEPLATMRQNYSLRTVWTLPYTSPQQEPMEKEDYLAVMLEYFHLRIHQDPKRNSNEAGRTVEWVDDVQDYLSPFLKGEVAGYKKSVWNHLISRLPYERQNIVGDREVTKAVGIRQIFRLVYQPKNAAPTGGKTVITRKAIEDPDSGLFRNSFSVQPEKTVVIAGVGLITSQILRALVSLGVTVIGSNRSPNENAERAINYGATKLIPLEKGFDKGFKEKGIPIDTAMTLRDLIDKNLVHMIVEGMDSKKPIAVQMPTADGGVTTVELSPSEYWRRHVFHLASDKGIFVNYQGGSDAEVRNGRLNPFVLEILGLPFSEVHAGGTEVGLFSCNGTTTLSLVTPLATIPGLEHIEMDVHFIRRDADFPLETKAKEVKPLAPGEKPKPEKAKWEPHHTYHDILEFFEQPGLHGKVNIAWGDRLDPETGKTEPAFMTTQVTEQQKYYHKVVTTVRAKKADGTFLTAGEYKLALQKAPNIALIHVPGFVRVEQDTDGSYKAVDLDLDHVNEVMKRINDVMSVKDPAITPASIEDLPDGKGFVIGALTFQRINVVPANLAAIQLQLGLVSPDVEGVKEANRRALQSLQMVAFKYNLETSPIGDPEIKERLLKMGRPSADPENGEETAGQSLGSGPRDVSKDFSIADHLDHLSVPATLYVDFRTLKQGQLSRDQLDELYKFAHRDPFKTTLVVYNAVPGDSSLEVFSGLKNLEVLSGDVNAAYQRYGDRGTDLELSKEGVDPYAASNSETRGHMKFFRYGAQDTAPGLVVAALLYSELTAIQERLAGIEERGGYFYVVGEFLRSLSAAYQSQLIVKRAA